VSANARAARLFVLVAWAVVFAAVWVTGTADHFLGPRTQWVVPFGAVALTLAAVAYGLALRSSRERIELTAGEATTLLAMLIPLGGLLLVPHATLGSFAASRKGDEGYFLRAAPPPPATPADISFLDIRVAEGDPQFAAEAGVRNGVRVRLLGLVTRSHATPPGTFELARFYIACCIADAEAVGVPVAGRSYKPNTWLVVSGTLERRGKRFVVMPDKLNRVQAPKQPYLSFQP
jgi:uncharacterized repeat protein (TIGR03943 family)